MTSPSLKRPLDLEPLTHNGQISDHGEDATPATNGEIAPKLETEDIKSPLGSDKASRLTDQCVSTNTNGNKRLCTTTSHQLATADPHNSPTQMSLSQDTRVAEATTLASLTRPSPSLSPTSLAQESQAFTRRSRSPISDDIDALIRNELHKVINTTEQRSNYGSQEETSEPPILTVRQAQSICERLIKVREQKLRDEYDKKLATKLAEQYDLFAKAKYLNTFAEQAMSPATSPIPTTAATAAAAVAAAAAAAASNNPSITNAIAAAFMQRSAVGGTVSPMISQGSVNPITTTTCTAQNLPNLANLAATLTASGHGNNLAQSHLTNSYLRQSGLRQAQLQHQHQQQQLARPYHDPIHLQHSLGSTHPHQLQHRNSICSSGGTIALGPVLLASNLDEQLATPEALFTLFGVFGDVVRVKILFNKKDNALIQMADANQAQVAQGNLDKQKIFGKVIRVTRSKHQLVQMPRDGSQTDAGLTKDFTNSPLHRFKIPGSRNCLNIYPPSNTLHISNIPPSVDESHLNKAFRDQCGFGYDSFKFFLKDRKMALMKFSSIEYATIALIKMHNFKISDENSLKVSFSKSSI